MCEGGHTFLVRCPGDCDELYVKPAQMCVKASVREAHDVMLEADASGEVEPSPHPSSSQQRPEFSRP